MGSPHTPEGYVWHIGIIMQALTSGSRQEILECLYMLAGTHAGTNYMHESFDPSAPEKYSRPWFAWANSLFAELLDVQYIGTSIKGTMMDISGGGLRFSYKEQLQRGDLSFLLSV